MDDLVLKRHFERLRDLHRRPQDGLPFEHSAYANARLMTSARLSPSMSSIAIQQ